MAKILRLTLCLLALGGSARAQTAKAYFEKGTAAFALGKYSEAAQAYESAFELKPDPALLYNAAQAHRLAGNKQRALSLYKSYLRMYAKQNRAEIQQRISELQQAIAQDQSKASTSPPKARQADKATIQADKTTQTDKTTTQTDRAPPNKPVVGERVGSPRVKTTPAGVTSSDPTLVAAAPPPRRSIATKPWFWGVMGSVIVVGVGVGLGVGLGLRSSSPTTPTWGMVNGN